MRVCNLLVAGLLAFMPLKAGMAQTVGPDLKAGSTGEAKAVKNGAGDKTHESEATGSAAGSGSGSTVAADHKGTNLEKKGATTGGGK